jgi:uncharacterized damage-inducible protein DinB
MAAPETIVEIKTKLETERAKLLDALANVPREVMLRPFGDGGWSIKDILAHVAMAETVNVKFAKMMVAKEEPLQLREFAAEYPDFTGTFELDKFNAWMTERWRAKSLEEIIAALKEARTDTFAWLATLTLAQLERTGQHAVWGKQSVRGMLRILVIHDKFHRGDIEKRKM